MQKQMSALSLFFIFVIGLQVGGCSEDNLVALSIVCETNAECDDADPCTLDACIDNGLRCESIPFAEGDGCEGPDGAGICLEGDCNPSECGDGFLDASNSEECDDGNNADGDGCASDCTQQAPVVTIDFPERGETLTGDKEVVVRGTVLDKGVGLDSFKVNGQIVTPDIYGNFEATIHSKHGLNFVAMDAVNKVGAAGRATVGYYHSQNYAELTDTEGALSRTDDGVVYRFSQASFDDGDHPCRMEGELYVCDEVDDLATVGEIILNQISEDSFGDELHLYSQDFEILDQEFPLPAQTVPLFGSFSLEMDGKIGLSGKVTVQSSVDTLDLNNVGMILNARDGGLDATVSINTADGKAGLSMDVRTSATLDVRAHFTERRFTVYEGSRRLANANQMCGVFRMMRGLGLTDDPIFDLVDLVCANSSDEYASLADLSPKPTAWVDSELAVERMTTQAYFDVANPAPGDIDVALRAGALTFHGSTIDLDLIRDMQIELGAVRVANLDALTVPLPNVNLRSVASGLSSFIDPLADIILNDVRDFLEPIISLLLFNPLDPVGFGNLLERYILSLGVEQKLELPELLTTAAAIEAPSLKTEITSLSFSAMENDELATGGMVAGFGTSIDATRAITRQPLGFALRGDCDGAGASTTPGFLSNAELEIAEQEDFLNQAFFSAWWVGGMNGRVNTLSDANFSLNFLTAPMVNGCLSEGKMNVQVADLRLTGTAANLGVDSNFVAYVNLDQSLTFQITDGQLQMATEEDAANLLDIDIESGITEQTDQLVLKRMVKEKVVNEFLYNYITTVFKGLPGMSFDLAAASNLDIDAKLNLIPTGHGFSNGYVRLSGTADGTSAENEVVPAEEPADTYSEPR